MTQSTTAAVRSQNIHIRVAPHQRALIDQAAKAMGKTRTDFILDTVTRAAENTLLDQRVFVLDDPHWERFIELLDAPPQPNEQLAKLMATKAPWE